MEINKCNILLVKEIQMNFGTCNLAPSNCQECSNRTFKRPIIDNKGCSNCPHKLDLACVGAQACNHTPRMTRSVHICIPRI